MLKATYRIQWLSEVFLLKTQQQHSQQKFGAYLSPCGYGVKEDVQWQYVRAIPGCVVYLAPGVTSIIPAVTELPPIIGKWVGLVRETRT